MSASDSEAEVGVIDRKLVLCPLRQTLSTEQLIQTCPGCQAFCLYCCYCSQNRLDLEKPCHHYRLVFTDGACRLNGQHGATAGMGFAIGLNELDQVSAPITELFDEGQKRTSQRAELLAAITGLGYLAEVDQLNEPLAKKRSKKASPASEKKSWIIATDSEYVVKGMTEWLPAWKVSRFTINLRASSDHTGRETTFEPIEERNPRTWICSCGWTRPLRWRKASRTWRSAFGMYRGSTTRLQIDSRRRLLNLEICNDEGRRLSWAVELMSGRCCSSGRQFVKSSNTIHTSRVVR